MELNDVQMEKLQDALLESLYKLQKSVDGAVKEFEEESGTAMETAYYLEDILIGLNQVTQLLSMLSFFEVVNDGKDPFERIGK